MARKTLKKVKSAEEYKKLIGTSVVAEEYTKYHDNPRKASKKKERK